MFKVKQHLLAANLKRRFVSSTIITSSSSSWTYSSLNNRRNVFHKVRQFSTLQKSSNCLIEKFSLFGRELFIAQDVIRDEEFSKYVSGNKWRKLQFLIHANDSMKQIREIHSYGSLQSNAMLSMAYLCFLNGWKFKYHVDRSLEYIETQRKMRMVGNLFETVKLKERGLDLEFIDSSDCYERIKEDFKKKCLGEIIQDGVLYVREGVAQKEAELGYINLAGEIIENMVNHEHVNVFLPSGTGTSALYLSKHLTRLEPKKFTVYTTNCVGNEEYLKKQFLELESNEKIQPKIISTTKNYRYGQLYPEIYTIIENIKELTGIQFDYLYDGKGFLTIQEKLAASSNSPLLYIHSGGLIGNESMKERYQSSNIVTK